MCHFAEHGVQLALEALQCLSLHSCTRHILAALTCYTLNSQIMSTIKLYSFFFRLLTLISIIPLCKKLRVKFSLSYSENIVSCSCVFKLKFLGLSLFDIK